VAGERARVGQIEQRIADEGAVVQRLVVEYDQAQALAEALRVRLRVTASELSTDRLAQARAGAQLRKVAVDAYVSGGELDAPTLLTSSASSQDMASVYVDVAGSRLDGAVEAFQRAEDTTRTTAVVLGKDEARAEATMRRLRPDQQAAQVALAADDVLLGTVKGNLHVLLTEEMAASEAAERRIAEHTDALAVAAAAAARTAASPPASTTAPPRASSTTGSGTTTTTPATTTPASAPPAPPVAPLDGSSGAYLNPLRAVGGLSPERIDQGVDYAGYGPIYAVGDGVVESIVNSGWPGGTFIAYRLTDGPAAGLTVYAAEDIDPTVQVGESVTPATQLGVVYAGPDGIETGWAAPGGVGDTMAAINNQFSGANSTAFGANFSQLLVSLGAPGGVLQNDPPTGSLPAGWPTW